MLANWFAHPGLLWLLLASPACAALLVYAFLRRRQLTAKLGSGLLARSALLVSPLRRRLQAICATVGIALLALAVAGPHWGLDKSASIRTGRDVVVVLDLSRSMSAEQPSRRDLALRALHDLADRFERAGGNRVALVAFAASPRLLFPLTHDYDHLRHTLRQIADDDYPSLADENAASGTRIGAAIQLAMTAFDAKRTGRPLIVLLSDGDDPAGDGEWRLGVAAAKDKRVRIFTVGVGDPFKAETIPAGRDVLTFDGEPVRTRLHEDLLREIARATGGEYLPARTGDYHLGAVVQQILAADELREEPTDDAELPIQQLRYDWFLLPAVLLFMLAMLLGGVVRARAPSEGQRRPLARRSAPDRFPVAVALLAAIVSISAAYPPDADEWLRLGNEAFAQKDYSAALDHYEKAEPLTTDPGRISFNKAAAYYRLGRYKEAIDCYRRALGDDQIPAERRARAHYDLGNALQQYAPDGLEELAAAIASYRACLAEPNLDAELRASARHNLEIAQLRWLKARALPKNAASKEEPKDTPYPKEPKNPENPDEQYVKVDPDKKAKKEHADDLPAASKTDRLQAGNLMILPDQDQIVPGTPAETRVSLADHARRIAEARRRHRHPDSPAALSSKDW